MTAETIGAIMSYCEQQKEAGVRYNSIVYYPPGDDKILSVSADHPDPAYRLAVWVMRLMRGLGVACCLLIRRDGTQWHATVCRGLP